MSSRTESSSSTTATRPGMAVLLRGGGRPRRAARRATRIALVAASEPGEEVEARLDRRAVISVLRDHAVNELAELGADASGEEGVEAARHLLEVAAQRLDHVGRRERVLPDDHLDERDAERVDVRLRAGALALALLGGHVARRPEEDPG